jgi:tetratricopeptide (TPR) repeat protein
MKVINNSWFLLLIIWFSFAANCQELLVYSDNDANAATDVILLKQKDDSFILMSIGGYSPQSAACVIKSKGNISNKILKGSLVSVNTDIVSYEIENKSANPFAGIISSVGLEITEANVSGLCGLNANFSKKYIRLTEKEDIKECIQLFIDIIKDYEGNDTLYQTINNYFVQNSCDKKDSKSFDGFYNEVFQLYQKGKKDDAAIAIIGFLKLNPESNNKIAVINVNKYNDLGFFLEQGKKYHEAVELLEKVVNAVPNRTVAYINLGDAYFGLKDSVKAKEAYLKYIDLIKKENKEKKIPQRVLDRSK